MTDKQIIELLKQAFFDENADFWEIMTILRKELDNE